MKLTQRQKDALGVIDDLTRKNDYPPTLQEVARRLGVNRTQAWRHVHALVAAGVVSFDEGKCRTITISKRVHLTEEEREDGEFAIAVYRLEWWNDHCAKESAA